MGCASAVRVQASEQVAVCVQPAWQEAEEGRGGERRGEERRGEERRGEERRGYEHIGDSSRKRTGLGGENSKGPLVSSAEARLGTSLTLFYLTVGTKQVADHTSHVATLRKACLRELTVMVVVVTVQDQS